MYSRTRFTFSNIQAGESKGKSAEPVDGQEALRAIAGLKGYYFAPDEQEIPVLEGNENVSPEAVEAMYADFSKRSVGLSGTDFEEVFPEGVRTSPQNQLYIDYNSVVSLLVEAVKEQQREIEELRKALEENGAMKNDQ